MKMVKQQVHFTGSCYCKKVKYEITGPAKANYFCHCEQCRKFTGSSHAANMQIPSEYVTFTEGHEYSAKFTCSSGRAFSKAFCSNCGSGLPFVGSSGELMYVPVGGLDNVPDDLVNYNIFWDDRANWYDAGIQAVKCKGFPPA